MLYNFIATAAPQAANTKSVAAFGGFTLLIPVILIGFMIWDSMQRKKISKKQKDMITSLKEGDKVVTVGGLVGEIASVQEDTVEIKVDKGIRLQDKKKAIAQVIK